MRAIKGARARQSPFVVPFVSMRPLSCVQVRDLALARWTDGGQPLIARRSLHPDLLAGAQVRDRLIARWTCSEQPAGRQKKTLLASAQVRGRIGGRSQRLVGGDQSLVARNEKISILTCSPGAHT
jgi:hypothetical protein